LGGDSSGGIVPLKLLALEKLINRQWVCNGRTVQRPYPAANSLKSLQPDSADDNESMLCCRKIGGLYCMVDILFCFRGRIGRLRFLIWNLVSAVTFVLAAHKLAGIAVHDFHLGVSTTTVVIVVVPPAIVFFWVQISLHAARIRDIGWKPLIVLPVFIAFNLADRIVAYYFPALAFEGNHITIAAVVVNAVFYAAVNFTPSAYEDGFVAMLLRAIPRPRIRMGSFRKPHPQTTIAAIPPRPVTARGQASFGRRGLN
jgi:uncharacterized membrane protein YhaH (DUF805 family)